MAGPSVWQVTGPLSGSGREEIALDIGPAGTPARFLLALLPALPGRFVLDGSARMRQRPMGPLVEELGIGAKGIGEPAIGAGGGALICALADAVGDGLIRRTPVHPEQIMMSLAAGKPSYEVLTEFK